MIIRIQRQKAETGHLREKPQVPLTDTTTLVLSKKPDPMPIGVNPVTRIRIRLHQKNGIIHLKFVGSREAGLSDRELQYWSHHLLGTLELPLCEALAYQSPELEATRFQIGKGKALKTLTHSNWWDHIEKTEVPELLQFPWFTDGKTPAVAQILYFKGLIEKSHLAQASGSVVEFVQHMNHGKLQPFTGTAPTDLPVKKGKDIPDWTNINTRAIRFTPLSLRKMIRASLAREPKQGSARNLLEKLARLPEVHSTTLSPKERENAQKLITVIHEEIPAWAVTEEDNMPFPTWFSQNKVKPSLKQMISWAAHEVDWTQVQTFLENAGIFPEFKYKDKTPTGIWRPWMAMGGIQKEAFQQHLEHFTLREMSDMQAGGNIKAIHGITLTGNFPERWLDEQEILPVIVDKQHLVWTMICQNPKFLAKIAKHKTSLGKKASSSQSTSDMRILITNLLRQEPEAGHKIRHWDKKTAEETVRIRMETKNETILATIDGCSPRMPLPLEIQIAVHKCINSRNIPFEPGYTSQDFDLPWNLNQIPATLPDNGCEIPELNDHLWWNHIGHAQLVKIFPLVDLFGHTTLQNHIICTTLVHRGILRPDDLPKFDKAYREEMFTVIRKIKPELLASKAKTLGELENDISRGIPTSEQFKQAAIAILKLKSTSEKKKGHREITGLRNLIFEAKRQTTSWQRFETPQTKSKQSTPLELLYQQLKPADFRQFTRDLPASWYAYWDLEPTEREISDFLRPEEPRLWITPDEAPFSIHRIVKIYSTLSPKKWQQILAKMIQVGKLPEAWTQEPSGEELDKAIIHSEEGETVQRMTVARLMTWQIKNSGADLTDLHRILKQTSKFADRLRQAITNGI
jgi:hypothetical protein